MCKLFMVFYVHMDGLCASDWESWEKSFRVLISVWEFFDIPIVVPELVFREVCVTLLPFVCILCWAGQSVYPLDYGLDL
jgi:hypothetical protein